MNRKLKKALREMYASEQPEHMKPFIEQLRKNQNYQKTHPSFARFTTPVIAVLVLSVITCYSYTFYRDTYQSYEPPQKIIPTETELLASESNSSTQETIRTTTKINSEMETHHTTTSLTTVSQTTILSDITTTSIPETVTEITEPFSEIIDTEFTDASISESITTTHTETIPQQTLTKQEICHLFAQEATFTELSEQYHLYTENTTDTRYPVTARSTDIPDILFLFRDSAGTYILDAVKAPVSILLPELIGHSVAESEALLNYQYCSENTPLWIEDNSAVYYFDNLEKSERLSENQTVIIINHEFKHLNTIHEIATQLQSDYFALYHPEIENYYASMNETDYQKIENLFAEVTCHVPQNHEYYQEWLTIKSGSVNSNHHPEDSYDIAMIYLEYINYTLLINDICTALEQQLPEDTYQKVQLLNENWTEKETYFFENVIPYHWDESHAEVVCFEAESAKCRCLILMMYLQDIS